MASVLTHAIITNAASAVDSYINTANGIYGRLTTTMNTLTGTNFTGDGSDGYREFFNTRIVPVLTTNLTDPGSSLTASIKSMLDMIQVELLDKVDPDLGNTNRNPGQAVSA